MPKKSGAKRKPKAASKPRPKQRPLAKPTPPKTPVKSPEVAISKNSTDSKDSNKVPKVPPVPTRPVVAKHSTDTTKSDDKQVSKLPIVKKDVNIKDEIKNKSGKKAKSGEKDDSKDKNPQDPNGAVNQVLQKDETGESGDAPAIVPPAPAVSKDTTDSRDQAPGVSADKGTAPDFTKITKPLLPHVKIKVAKEKLKKDPALTAAQASRRKIAAARSVALSAKCSGEAFRTDLFGAIFLAPYISPTPEKPSKEVGIESNTTSSEDG